MENKADGDTRNIADRPFLAGTGAFIQQLVSATFQLERITKSSVS